MRNILPYLIFIFIVCSNIFSDEIEIDEKDIKNGVVLKVNDRFVFLKNDSVSGEVIKIDEINFVKVVPTKKIDGKNIVIPVEIRDVEIARGIVLEIGTGKTKKYLNIPKRKVFVPHRFYLIYPGDGEKGEAGGKDGTLILEVYPRLSYALDVQVSDTPDDGLITKFKYEDIFAGKIFDILNEMDKRDINVSLNLKYGKRQRFEFNSEGFLNHRTARRIGVLTSHPLSSRIDGEIRIDNFKDDREINVGGNLIYTRGNKEIAFGNVSKVVQDFLHLQGKTTEKWGNIILRMENFSTHKDTNFKGTGIVIKEVGGQINLQRSSNLNFSVGNLIIGQEDNPLYGQVDDKLNFLFDWSDTAGTYYAPLDMKRPVVGIVWSMKVLGEGETVYLKGKLNCRYNITPSFYIQYNLSDDFITLSGTHSHPPWQNRSLVFIRHRSFLEDKSIVGKLSLEYIFLEMMWKRTDYSTSFSSTQKIKFGFGKTVEILSAPIPLEFFIEKDTSDKWKPGSTISFRTFLN